MTLYLSDKASPIVLIRMHNVQYRLLNRPNLIAYIQFFLFYSQRRVPDQQRWVIITGVTTITTATMGTTVGGRIGMLGADGSSAVSWWVWLSLPDYS